MATAVVGAGPVGLVCALALATAGEEVLLLDPDAGPSQDGSWRRRGVMQFRHPHFFRHIVRQVLESTAPAMWQAVVAVGCVVNAPPDGIPPALTTVSARRSTFEAALRSAARHERVHHVPRRADRVLVQGDRVVGVEAGGARWDADRVIVATGRSGRLGDRWRPPAEGGPCGQSYVSRMYRARPGVDAPRAWNPIGEAYDGYLTIVFPQDAGTLSALVVRPAADRAWDPLRHDGCFDAVAAQIPNLAPWTDPERFEPITAAMRGGTLLNSYRGQGAPPAGLFFVGDTVCTTNPSAGRGVSLGLLQASALLDALARHADAKDASTAFDVWCGERVRPWFDDHVAADASVLRRSQRWEIAEDDPVTSDVICSAAAVDPALRPDVDLFLGMLDLPSRLTRHEARVRALLAGGWRPRPAAGPTRDELVDVMARSTAAHPGARPALVTPH